MERLPPNCLAITLLTVATGSVIYFCVTEHLFSPFLFYLLLLGLLLILNQAIKKYNSNYYLDCQQILFSVFFINVIAVVLLYYWLQSEVGIPYLAPGYWQDDWEFEHWSRLAYLSSHSLNYFDFTDYVPKAKHEGFFYLIGLVMHIGDLLGGYNTLMPRLLNSFLLALVCLLTYFIGLEISFAHKPCKVAALFLGFFPANIYYSAVILREDLSATIVCCLLLIHLKSLKWHNVRVNNRIPHHGFIMHKFVGNQNLYGCRLYGFLYYFDTAFEYDKNRANLKSYDGGIDHGNGIGGGWQCIIQR